MKYQISSLTILTPKKTLKHIMYSKLPRILASRKLGFQDARPLTEAELLDSDSQIHTRKTRNTKYQNSSLTILAKKKP